MLDALRPRPNRRLLRYHPQIHTDKSDFARAASPFRGPSLSPSRSVQHSAAVSTKALGRSNGIWLSTSVWADLLQSWLGPWTSFFSSHPRVFARGSNSDSFFAFSFSPLFPYHVKRALICAASRLLLSRIFYRAVGASLSTNPCNTTQKLF